jgi:hypothetical protein
MTDTPTVNDLFKEKLYIEQVLTLDDGVTEVTARVNDKVVQRIRKYLPVLLEQRGLSGVDSLDETHPDVSKKLQARSKSNENFSKVYRRRQRGLSLKGKDQELYARYLQAAIQAVQASNTPRVQFLLFQVATWAVLYDDLFSFDDNGNPQFRIEDVEVPDSYWSVGVKIEDEEEDPLDRLLGIYSHKVESLEIDRNNPFEWMLALCITLVSDDYNPEFSENLLPVLQRATYFILLENSWRDMDVDEAGFQLDSLVGDLEEEVREADSDDVGPKPRRRVRKADEAAESGGSEGSGESQEDEAGSAGTPSS